MQKGACPKLSIRLTRLLPKCLAPPELSTRNLSAPLRTTHRQSALRKLPPTQEFQNPFAIHFLDYSGSSSPTGGGNSPSLSDPLRRDQEGGNGGGRRTS